MPPCEARRSSSKISPGDAESKTVRPLPSACAMSWMIRQSCRASPGSSTALLILMTRPSTVRDDAFVLLLQRAGQHDVGVAGGFVEEEIDRDVEFQLFQHAR